MYAPFVLATLTIVFIVLAAATVRVMGINAGYKALFFILGFAIVLKTMLGW